MRRGAPAAVATAPAEAVASLASAMRGSSEGRVGRAMHAPRPRRNRRRLNDHCRSLVSCLSESGSFIMQEPLLASGRKDLTRGDRPAIMPGFCDDSGNCCDSFDAALALEGG